MIFRNQTQFVIVLDIYSDIPLPSTIQMMVMHYYNSDSSPHIAFISHTDIPQFLIGIIESFMQDFLIV